MLEGSLAARDYYEPAPEKSEPTSFDWNDPEENQEGKVELGEKIAKVTIARSDAERIYYAAEELNRIAALPPDWDSYGAPPISLKTLEEAFEFYLKLMWTKEVLPQISATSRGGVSFEWHEDGKGLEITVSPASEVHAYFYNDASGEEWEHDVGEALDELDYYLDQFSD